MAAAGLAWGCGPSVSPRSGSGSGSGSGPGPGPGTGSASEAAVSPRALVSLSPGVTATILALGAEARLVGVSDYCDLPSSSTLPRLGTALTPRLEAVAALPERGEALAVAAEMNIDWTASLGGLIATRSLPWRSAAELSSSVRALGELVEAPAAADALARRLDAALDDAGPETELRVALLLDGTAAGDGGFWFISRTRCTVPRCTGPGSKRVCRRGGGTPKIGPEQRWREIRTLSSCSNRSLDEDECQRALGRGCPRAHASGERGR